MIYIRNWMIVRHNEGNKIYLSIEARGNVLKAVLISTLSSSKDVLTIT